MIIRAGGLPRGGPVAERLLEWLAPIARVSGGSGGYPASHLMRFFALVLDLVSLCCWLTLVVKRWHMVLES